MSEWAPALMFVALFALLFLGVPVSLSMAGIAFAAGAYTLGGAAGQHLWTVTADVARNQALTAVPMFVLMGFLLARSGIAERLFSALQLVMRGLPSGMALAAITMCGVFAAATGIVGAVEVLVGLMAIPPMMRSGYSKPLIAGSICAGGSLGTIIPPSIIVVVYASVADMSIGDLTAGILIPGLMTMAAFAGYIMLHGWLKPQDAPRPDTSEFDRMSSGQKAKLLVSGILPVAALIVVVLGSILAGVASATEAAAMGVIGAVVLSALYRVFNVRNILDACRDTVKISVMILLVVLAGTMFTSMFILVGGASAVLNLIESLQLSQGQLVFAMGLIIFVLGYPFDWVTIVLICVPIFQPLIVAHGIDPLWFGVLALVIMQTSYLTPPVAPSIIYLRSIAPPEMTYRDMTRGVLPFLACQIIVIAAVAWIPSLATFLPSALTRF
ncbi:TRAP transporter large permease [Bordetella petrii]|uniref:TRAP transporter large permease n=1 Tax=Bordetella petrii TaxID=94624 RepID=UPI00047EF70F|nr:TRAP transporter large permease subunit [Bordetella petrii]